MSEKQSQERKIKFRGWEFLDILRYELIKRPQVEMKIVTSTIIEHLLCVFTSYSSL